MKFYHFPFHYHQKLHMCASLASYNSLIGDLYLSFSKYIDSLLLTAVHFSVAPILQLNKKLWTKQKFFSQMKLNKKYQNSKSFTYSRKFMRTFLENKM